MKRVVIVGGGASGTLVSVHLLRRGGAGLHVVVVEPRAALGQGVAFGTRDPWHRLNVPAITMTGLPEDPDHFRAFAGVAPDVFPPRQLFGEYLGALLAEARAGSAATLEHVRARVAGVAPASAGSRFVVSLDDGRSLDADAVVIATGNELPRVPSFAAGLVDAGDMRLIADPWAPGSLDAVEAGETVAIIGTGHTAIDLAASLIRGRGAGRVVAISRHGEVPRPHEDPWRPRPSMPAFTPAEFASWPDKPAELRRRFEAYPLGWRQALDSMRPVHKELWLAMSEDERREFVTRHRREWEIHRSRLAPGVLADVLGWVTAGRLELRAASIDRIEPAPGSLRIVARPSDRGPAEAVDVGHVLVATGPDESASASPLLAALVAAGLARPASQDLGIDVDPYDFRVLDATGSPSPGLFALGPIIRGAVWECIAIPEIRLMATRIAEQLTAP